MSEARTAYNKRKKRTPNPVALAKVLETNTNSDGEFGDDIGMMRELEYDV